VPPDQPGAGEAKPCGLQTWPRSLTVKSPAQAKSNGALPWVSPAQATAPKPEKRRAAFLFPARETASLRKNRPVRCLNRPKASSELRWPGLCCMQDAQDFQYIAPNPEHSEIGRSHHNPFPGAGTPALPSYSREISGQGNRIGNSQGHAPGGLGAGCVVDQVASQGADICKGAPRPLQPQMGRSNSCSLSQLSIHATTWS